MTGSFLIFMWLMAGNDQTFPSNSQASGFFMAQLSSLSQHRPARENYGLLPRWAGNLWRDRDWVLWYCPNEQVSWGDVCLQMFPGQVQKEFHDECNHVEMMGDTEGTDFILLRDACWGWRSFFSPRVLWESLPSSVLSCVCFQKAPGRLSVSSPFSSPLFDLVKHPIISFIIAMRMASSLPRDLPRHPRPSGQPWGWPGVEPTTPFPPGSIRRSE